MCPWGYPAQGVSLALCMYHPCSTDALCLSFPMVSCPHNHCLSVPGSCAAAPGSWQTTEGLPALQDTTESPFWTRVCSINAIVLLCINIFCYAYFA